MKDRAESDQGSRRTLRNPAIIAALIGVAGALLVWLISKPPEPDPVVAVQKKLGEVCERMPGSPDPADFAPVDVRAVPLNRQTYLSAFRRYRRAVIDEIASLPRVPPGKLTSEAHDERDARLAYRRAMRDHLRFVQRSAGPALTIPAGATFQRALDSLHETGAHWIRAFDRLAGGRCIRKTA
jgi:hypothetical protein